MVNFTVASSETENVPRYRRTVTPSRGVCRSLFGTVDHDEFQEEVRKQNIEKLQRKKTEYNFDFEKEEPLPGRYLWEKVSRTTNCNKLTTDDKPIPKSIRPPIANGTAKSSNRSLRDGKEHKITDYFRAKKRKYDGPTTEMDLKRSSLSKKHSCSCSNTCECTGDYEVPTQPGVN